MLNGYDLYDLAGIFVRLRTFPSYEKNAEILSAVMDVLSHGEELHDLNAFRTALSAIPGLDRNVYGFVYTQNIYVHMLPLMKEPAVYRLLLRACEELRAAVDRKEVQRTADLADCLHNLPVIVVEHKGSVPAFFWKNEVKWYRQRWDGGFLREEEKLLHTTGRRRLW